MVRAHTGPRSWRLLPRRQARRAPAAAEAAAAEQPPQPPLRAALLAALGLAGLSALLCGGTAARAWLLAAARGRAGAALRLLQAAEEFSKEHVNRCREPRGNRKEYGVVLTLPSMQIENCGSVAAVEVLPANDEVTHISHRCLSYLCRPPPGSFVSAEVVLVVRRRGGIYQLDVVTAGDYKHWTVNLPPTRKIKDHSCLDDNQFCDVVSVTPLESGFIVMDRHRVLEFQFTWQPDDNYRLVRHIGQMNAVNTEATYGSLHFPSAAALYQPLNATHIDEEIAITPLFPDARGRFLFVTDTGNHRVVMLNCSSAGQLAYIGQFGITGEARHNSTGLDSPWGIAVYAPAWESFFQPVFANVFVVDRRNSRLVKLDLGYRGSQPPEEDELPRLAYSGDYRSGATVSETLVDPTGVALYRHYVLVAEARGNAILVLVVDHQTTTRMRFVTHLRPARGVQLTGSIAASPLAYVWFSYITSPNDYGLGSLFLHEALRWSFKPSRLADLIDTCQNSTWYDVVLRFNRTMYMDFVGSALGAARINWMFPSMPGYVDVQSFNRTADFNLDAFNRTVFQGRMTLCQPPPPPPPPSMLSGNSDGWKMENRMSPAQADARRLYACTCWWILLQWVCCGLSLWPL